MQPSCADRMRHGCNVPPDTGGVCPVMGVARGLRSLVFGFGPGQLIFLVPHFNLSEMHHVSSHSGPRTPAGAMPPSSARCDPAFKSSCSTFCWCKKASILIACHSLTRIGFGSSVLYGPSGSPGLPKSATFASGLSP